MNEENLRRSKKYRTIHSIKDYDVELIDSFFNTENITTFLDYGCHFGHLAIYLAKTYPVKIYAVDNFIGSLGDKLMENTISSMTTNGNFYSNVISNIKENEPFKGEIILEYSDTFLSKNIEFDFVFIDSSHREEEAEEFKILFNKVKPGGLIGGHDYIPGSREPGYIGVEKGINFIKDKCTWLVKDYTWIMRKA